jgi:hypothetical protein
MSARIVKVTKRSSRPTIEQLEQRVQQRWFALTQAEDAGADDAALTDLFAQYMADLDALVVARATQDRRPVPITPAPRAIASA